MLTSYVNVRKALVGETVFSSHTFPALSYFVSSIHAFDRPGMLLCIFEDESVRHLQPLVWTRAACMLRSGRRTHLEEIRDNFPSTGVVLHCRSALKDFVGQQTGLSVNRIPDGVDVLFVNGRLADPSGVVAADVLGKARGSDPIAFMTGETLTAAWIPSGQKAPALGAMGIVSAGSLPAGARRVAVDAVLVDRLWRLLDHIRPSIEADFNVLTSGYNVFERPGAMISTHSVLVDGERTFVAPGAEVRAGAVLDASSGPIIIDRDAIIFENAVLRGPVSVGERSNVKVGSVIDTSVVGPWCKVAGEINRSIITGFTNKAHPGYLGDSVLGSWCNLGADTNTSNLRNDYAPVPLYSEVLDETEDTGRTFVGLFMGDHSKCGIDTMFNTGTVIGVFCNLFGAGYQPRYVPSFMWGSPRGGYTTYRLQKALEVARAVMARRDRSPTPAEEALLEGIFNETEEARKRGPRT